MPNSQPVTQEDIASIREGLAALREFKHAQANKEMAERLAAKPSGLPVWAIWLFAIGGFCVASIGVAGVIWSGGRQQQEIVSTQTQHASQLAVLATLPSRVMALESGVETGRRIRDQQQQATADRVRALELADQSGTERLNVLAQTIAGILPRLEEILRRQERLESRLGAMRQGAPQEPEDTAHHVVPLVWRP